ncbi:MAG: helix-turn-helix domain-containing protein [Acidimicrobiia bacterium]
MTTARRIGTEDSATRVALIDAALQLMAEEGYAAVTSRKVAAKAGLKPQLVHYYFRTMDDLFLALLQRGAEQNMERQARALRSPQPVRALWEMLTDPAGAMLTQEFSALANHRKDIRAEYATLADRFRQQQEDMLKPVLADYGIDPQQFPTDALLLMLHGISRILVLEEQMGVERGHESARRLVEDLLTQYEGRPKKPRRRPAG